MIIDEKPKNVKKGENKFSKIVVKRQKLFKSTAFSGESSILSSSFNQSHNKNLNESSNKKSS